MAANTIQTSPRQGFVIPPEPQLTERLDNADQVLLNRKFWTYVPFTSDKGVDDGKDEQVGIEVRLLYTAPAEFTLSLTGFLGHPVKPTDANSEETFAHMVTWSRQFNGDLSWSVGLWAGLKAELDLANWAVTTSQVTFDIAIKITEKFLKMWSHSEHVTIALPTPAEIHALADADADQMKALLLAVRYQATASM